MEKHHYAAGKEWMPKGISSMNKARMIFVSLFFLSIGIVIGGYLFNRSQPRSFLSLNQCQDCWKPKDLAGLVASVGIQKLPNVIPQVVFETDKTIAIKNPMPEASVDYVLFPKKDIKSIGEISEEDAPFVMDTYFVARYLIEKESLRKYRIFTNGPGFQDVTYLHFHLIGK